MIGRFFEDVGLELGLKPVRGLVEVEPRWRQEAEHLVRAGAPGGSGGSPTDRLRNFEVGGTRCGLLLGSKEWLRHSSAR